MRRGRAWRHEVGNLLGAARLVVDSMRADRSGARATVPVPRAQLDALALAVEELTRLIFPPPEAPPPRKKKRRR